MAEAFLDDPGADTALELFELVFLAAVAIGVLAACLPSSAAAGAAGPLWWSELPSPAWSAARG